MCALPQLPGPGAFSTESLAALEFSTVRLTGQWYFAHVATQGCPRGKFTSVVLKNAYIILKSAIQLCIAESFSLAYEPRDGLCIFAVVFS